MFLKITPKVDRRYWAAILVASMFGTNLGDFLPDVLKLSAINGFAVLGVSFALIIAGDRLLQCESEAFYWLALLVVRAAATIIADVSIDRLHLGYVTVTLGLAALFAPLLAVSGQGITKTDDDLPPTTGAYWLTMLVAGSLGTVIGDGAGHMFGSVQIGVPISAGLATLSLALVLGLRAGVHWKTASSYWIAVVVIRWWGTNCGDISKFVLSIGISMALTGGTLALILLLWRQQPTVRDASAIDRSA